MKNSLVSLVILSGITMVTPQTLDLNVASEESQPQIVIKDHANPVKKPEVKKVELLPALVPICACESALRKDGKPTQFNPDGTVRRGKVNHNDIGMCQINIEPRNGHLAQAKKMGLDLFTEEGNIKYANWLYKQEGSSPWNWSKNCWK